jgi:putative transposase
MASPARDSKGPAVGEDKPGKASDRAHLKNLVIRIARENPRWGYMRIRGELLKLGRDLPATTIRDILRRAGIGPTPRRDGPGWTEFLRAQATTVVACDFFTAYTLWGRVVYVLFFIELSTRRVHLAGCTANPDSAWIVQQARNLCLSLDQRTEPLRLLIHGRDSKFSGAFDEVFSTEGIEIIKTPIRSPRANAIAERWIRTVRAECLDWLLIAGDRHLHRVLRTYVNHYNQQRPHRGLDLKAPETVPTCSTEASRCPSIRRRDRLGGLIHEYRVAA